MVKLLRRNKNQTLDSARGNFVIERMASADYWQGHDLSVKFISSRICIQRMKRLSWLSFSTMSAILRRENTHFGGTSHDDADEGTEVRNNEVGGRANSVYLQCMDHLLSLCGHEYESIRNKATKCFDHVASHFGSSLNNIIRSLLLSLSNPSTSYFAAAGAIQLLSHTRIQKRLTGQWGLFSSFVRSVCNVQTLLSSIPEPDRRERCLQAMTNLLVKYSVNWHHLPLGSTVKCLDIMYRINLMISYRVRVISPDFFFIGLLCFPSTE